MLKSLRQEYAQTAASPELAARRSRVLHKHVGPVMTFMRHSAGLSRTSRTRHCLCLGSIWLAEAAPAVKSSCRQWSLHLASEDNMRLRSTWIDVLQITQNIVTYGSQDGGMEFRLFACPLAKSRRVALCLVIISRNCFTFQDAARIYAE